MKPRHEQRQLRQLTLALRRNTRPEMESDAAEQIRQLPNVSRVEPHLEQHEIDVWYRFPSDDLLPEIHQILEDCRCRVAVGRLR
jgi:hypothetical protein